MNRTRGAGPATAFVGAALGADLSWAVLGAVYGIVTGRMLVWLLHQPALAASTEAWGPKSGKAEGR